MTIEKIKEHLHKIQENMEKMKKDEKKWTILLRQAEDAAKLKIIHKGNMSIEQLEYLRGINDEELELIRRKRREEEKNAAEKEPSAPEKD